MRSRSGQSRGNLVPLDQGHWHYNVDREIRLDKPAKTVYLRYIADPGVNNLRIYAHCLDNSGPPSVSPNPACHPERSEGSRQRAEEILRFAQNDKGDGRRYRGGKVVITHAWKEDGMPKSKTITLTKPGPYEITTLAEPTDDSIELSIPSSGDSSR